MTTEPITLQGIYLGPFEIRLDWASHAGDDCAYRVIANEPHPAESRENVTHPHVMDEILCEGHSRHAIRQALAQRPAAGLLHARGQRPADLQRGKPVRGARVWHGAACSDCGAVVDEDDRYVCQKCDETICAGCETSLLRLRRLVLLAMHYRLRSVRRQLLPQLPEALQRVPAKRLPQLP